VATPTTSDAPEPEPKRAFIDRPLGRVAILLAVFLLALIALKTCAAPNDKVSFEEAEAIARKEVDFEPEQVIVKGVKRGLDSHLFWAVSLSTTNAAGITVACATVEVDAETGETEKRLC
jgi:hypothetical protein